MTPTTSAQLRVGAEPAGGTEPGGCLVAGCERRRSGFLRTWSDEEREIAARMQALLDLGVTLGAAARIARHEKAQTVLAVLSEAMSA